ncbi:methionine--tRNA ligase, partial [Patescibacteria group bacterium]|nr:methionine--tRNA ligase [Patescibacteria group bacterium]
MKSLYITTAIPYVNADPHVGFALELIQTDVVARYWKNAIGPDDVRFVTGSDENSLKNVLAAEKAGQAIEIFVEEHAAKFAALNNLLGVDYDDFIRTREPRHLEGAQKLWSSCKPEDIYKKSYQGLYCVGCEQFYTEKECPDKICPEHKTELEIIEEENYFFKLSNYQSQLEELIVNDQIKIVPESRKNETLSFIRGGLEDFSISRSVERAKHWGVPVPGDQSQVMYVWFDALSNYINALDYAKEGVLYQKFWNSDEVKRVHVIGKGILRFHAVYWPAMLLSAGIKLPNEIFVHGYVTAEGVKMSKSLGNVVAPQELVDEYGQEAV